MARKNQNDSIFTFDKFGHFSRISVKYIWHCSLEMVTIRCGWKEHAAKEAGLQQN